MLMLALWLQAAPDAATGTIQDMNNALSPYIVGHTVGTVVLDSLVVAVFLGTVTIARYFVSRRKETKA
jgi:hypothetical protein